MPKPVKPPNTGLSRLSVYRIGADCEDSCCIGWIVNIDKRTYEAYQCCDDPELGPRLQELVTISAGASEDNHARITLSGPSCPFFSEGLCAIQKVLGEQYLSKVCARYPRVINVVDGVLQRSLDLSCPEAARMVLLDPSPMAFEEEDEDPPHDSRLGHLSVLRTLNENSDKPYQYFREIRDFVIWLLQYRTYPLWKRLAILGSFCDQLHEMAAASRNSQTPEVVEAYHEAAIRDLFGQALNTHCPRPMA